MAKGIIPTDAESLLKQGDAAHAEGSNETRPVRERSSEKQVMPEGMPEKFPFEAEGSTQEEISQVAEFPGEAMVKISRKISSAPPKLTDRLEEEIEDILEEDLKEIYLSMPPDKRIEFKRKGEETRSKIRVLLKSAKVNAKKIFQLIRSWLKIIPGVNRYFLEQEAKIKTDKIFLVSEEERKRTQNESL